MPIIVPTGIKNYTFYTKYDLNRYKKWFLIFYEKFVYASYHIPNLYIITQNIQKTNLIQFNIYMK